MVHHVFTLRDSDKSGRLPISPPPVKRHPKNSPAQRATDELAVASGGSPSSFSIFLISVPHLSPPETSRSPPRSFWRRSCTLHFILQPLLELSCQCRPKTLSVLSFSLQRLSHHQTQRRHFHYERDSAMRWLEKLSIRKRLTILHLSSIDMSFSFSM